MSRRVFDEVSPEEHAAFLEVMPELSGNPPRRVTPAHEAEARLLGFVLRDLRNLDHLPSLKLDHFGDDQYRAVFGRLLRARAAGHDGMDLLAVAAQLPGVIEPHELALIEQQADGMTTGSAASLIPLVEQKAQRRKLLETGQALMTLALDPARSLDDGIEAGRAVLAEIRTAPAAQPFTVVSLLDNTEPTPPSFVWDGLVPADHVTLFGAHGGTGKSMIALQLCVAVAAGLPLFGIPTRQGPAVFFSGEDGADLLRWRLRFICEQIGVDAAELASGLHLIDATERDPVLFAESQAGGRRTNRTTPTYDALRAFLVEHKPALVVIDNASDVFGGNEIDRASVRAFMRSLGLLGREVGAAVVLLAHVDKGTSRGGFGSNTEGYSGSTAWNNSARSRLFMSRDKAGDLTLEHQKSNLGKLHEPIRLIWPEGGLPQLDEQFGPVVQGIADRNHERSLLKLIYEFTQRGEFVSTATTSRTHAAKLLRHEPAYPDRLKDNEVFDLLRRAERAGYLERITFKGPDRKSRERWSVTPDGAAFAGFAATAATAATYEVTAPTAHAAMAAAATAATAATSPRGYGGKSAHIEVAADSGSDNGIEF